jgi:hypothetical protein
MNKTKGPFKLDERGKLSVSRVIAIITILAMQGVIMYRQFALRQDIQVCED